MSSNKNGGGTTPEKSSGARTESIPNDPLVLHVDLIQFDPTVHIERRKLSIDFEITQDQQKQLVEEIRARQKSSTRGVMRIRFVGRPV